METSDKAAWSDLGKRARQLKAIESANGDDGNNDWDVSFIAGGGSSLVVDLDIVVVLVW